MKNKIITLIALLMAFSAQAQEPDITESDDFYNLSLEELMNMTVVSASKTAQDIGFRTCRHHGDYSTTNN